MFAQDRLHTRTGTASDISGGLPQLAAMDVMQRAPAGREAHLMTIEAGLPELEPPHMLLKA
jgi:hypothetical protein